MFMIHRADHRKSFLKLSNETARDNNLSFEARGFLAYLLTMDDNFAFSCRGLAALTGRNKNTISRIVKELQKNGYVEFVKSRSKKGQFDDYEWVVRETPCTDLPYTVSRDTVSRDTVKRDSKELPIERITNRKNNQTKEKAEPISCPRYGEFSNVKLTEEEFVKLGDKLGETERDRLIFELSCYLRNHPNKYKDHYATVLSWSRKKGKEQTAHPAQQKKYGIDVQSVRAIAQEIDQNKIDVDDYFKKLASGGEK